VITLIAVFLLFFFILGVKNALFEKKYQHLSNKYGVF